MFTGIITETGKIETIENSKDGKIFSVITDSILRNKKIGDSIAVDGVCVTILKIDKKKFTFLTMPETLTKTRFSDYKTGDLINLEPALTLNQTLDGHLIQGHVDTTCEVSGFSKKNSKAKLKIMFPDKLAGFLALKGSVSINGVSLTISDVEKNNFTVDLIPHTIKSTNLSELKKGDKVNIEVDLIARYLKRLIDTKEKEAKYEFLKERGFI